MLLHLRGLLLQVSLMFLSRIQVAKDDEVSGSTPRHVVLTITDECAIS